MHQLCTVLDNKEDVQRETKEMIQESSIRDENDEYETSKVLLNEPSVQESKHVPFMVDSQVLQELPNLISPENLVMNKSARSARATKPEKDYEELVGVDDSP